MYWILFYIVAPLYDAQVKVGLTNKQLAEIRSGKTFTCLNKENTIPLSWLNDDYCDCSDGSDENRTSACRNGLFLCHNRNHKAQYISSYRVNDGVCDCCDGSDEYGKRIECLDICEQVKNLEFEKEQKRLETLKDGLQIKENLVSEGKKRKQEITLEINTLKYNETIIKSDLEQLNQQKADIENIIEFQRQQKESLDQHKIACKILFDAIDKDNDSKINTEELIEAGHKFINMVNNISRTSPHAQLLSSGIGLEYFSKHVYSDIFKVSKLSLGNDSSSTSLDDAMYNVESQVDEVSSPKSLNELDRKITELEQALTKIQNKINEYESILSFNFGKHMEFLTMYGQQINLENNEYTYELRLFKSTHQVSKQNKQSICIGKWSNWKDPTLNDIQNEYHLIMRYDNGDGCWNGPTRSTNVYLKCGTVNRIMDVKESVRCLYEMFVESPAACINDTKTFVRDEL